jgi:hypothetical protein
MTFAITPGASARLRRASPAALAERPMASPFAAIVPVITQLIGLSPWGTTILGDVPNEEALCGCAIEMQVVEADPDAVKGVSFTAGLELVPGH